MNRARANKNRFYPMQIFVTRDDITDQVLRLMLELYFPDLKIEDPHKMKRLRSFIFDRITNGFCQRYADQRWEGGVVKDMDFYCTQWYHTNTKIQQEVKDFIKFTLNLDL